MSRSRRRISRALLGLLACTLALGLVFWLHNLNKTRAAEQAGTDRANAAVVAPPPAREPEPEPAPAAPVKPAETTTQTIALVTQTPTSPAGAPTHAPAPQNLPPGSISITPSTQSSARQFANATPLAPPKSAAPIHSTKPLADAKARIDAGDLLTARTILNTALLDKNLSAADVATAKRMLSEVNQSLVFSPRKFNDDEFATSHTVKPGEYLKKIASQYDLTAELIQRLNGISDARKMQAGRTLKIIRGPFHAVVDKSEFTMEIYLGSPGEAGSVYVTTYRVGLGADDSTPTGTWSVEPQKKIKNPTYFSPRGEGVIEADDPANPLGEFWIGLTGIDGQAVGKESYGIHGTIEPDSIGKQASMGCIRMGKDDIALAFELLVEGKSTVIVRD